MPPPPSAATIEQGATVDGGAVPGEGGTEGQPTEEELREQFSEPGGSLPTEIPDVGTSAPAEESTETTVAEGASG